MFCFNVEREWWLRFLNNHVNEYGEVAALAILCQLVLQKYQNQSNTKKGPPQVHNTVVEFLKYLVKSSVYLERKKLGRGYLSIEQVFRV